MCVPFYFFILPATPALLIKFKSDVKYAGILSSGHFIRLGFYPFTISGAQIGNVMTFPLAGLLCEYGFDGGWPSIFYILGESSTFLFHIST